MFDTICTLPLTSDLFAQAIHPKTSIIAVGLASGHVQSYVLPNLDSSPDAPPKNGCGTVDTAWRTKRHKGSCRSLDFSSNGETLYSAGTDGIVKAARMETGEVEAKIAVPLYNSLPDPPCLVHALTPQSLLLATDSSALHLYDLRTPFSKLSSTPQATYHPHTDYIASLTPVPPTTASTSGFPKQIVTTGGTTLAVTDLRRGVLVKSEDQEEELLSSVFVSGVGKKGKSEKLLVGTGSGILTMWEKGMWEDQQGRVIVDGVGKESVDALTLVPGKQGMAAVGMGDGRVKFVKVGGNQVVGECRHDEVEGLVGLGFEVGGRMVSGGGGVVKVWQESVEYEDEDEDEDEDEAEAEGEGEIDGAGSKQGLEGSNEGQVDESGTSDEEEKARKKRKKRKRGGEKGKNGGKAVMKFTGID